MVQLGYEMHWPHLQSAIAQDWQKQIVIFYVTILKFIEQNEIL